MYKPTAVALSLFLALASCGGPQPTTPQPAPAAEVADDTDDGARVLASGTFKMTAAQAVQSLGLRDLATTAPTAPVTVTVAVKMGTPGGRYAGQKRAFIGWKLNGKSFPGELTGTTTGSYTLALKNPDGSDVVKAKAGTVSVALPLASGNMTTSRSRSTSYAAVSGGTCAVASSSLTLANGSAAEFGTAPAPLVVCEAGTVYAPPSSPPAPALELSDMVQSSTFTTRAGQVGALVTFSQVPEKAVMLWTKYQYQQAEECGAGDAYGVGASGEWQLVTNGPNTRSFFVAVDEQSMVQEHYGLAYQFAFKDEGTANGETLLREGLLCYAPS